MRVDVDPMPNRSRLARCSDSLSCLRWRSLLMPNRMQKSARPPKMIPNTVPTITPRGTLVVEGTTPKLEGSRLGVRDGSMRFVPISCEGTSGWIVMFATIWRVDKLGRMISQELDEDEDVPVVVTFTGCVVEYCVVEYCVVEYCVVEYCVVEYCVVEYCVVEYCVVEYCVAETCVAEYEVDWSDVV